MPSNDMDLWDCLSLGVEFHKGGALKAALETYATLEHSLQSSGIDGENIFPISLNQMLRVLQDIAQADLNKNSRLQDLAVEIIKASDRSCILSYDFLPSRALCQAEKSNFLLQVQGWIGRLGNNLTQIANSIAVAKLTNSIVIFPPHPTLNLYAINYSMSYLVGPVRTQWTDCFFTPQESMGFQCSPVEKRNVLVDLPDTLFNFSKDFLITDSTLVIHLRSGDVLSGKVGNNYHQPPLSVYQKIIEMGHYQDIVIVTEESRVNPCAQSLVDYYQSRVDSIRIQYGSLQDDINTILSARHLVLSNSSFAVMLGLASKYLKYVHCLVPLCTYWGLNEINDIEVFNWSAPDYPGDLDWSDVDAAYQAMLNFPLERIMPPENLDKLWSQSANSMLGSVPDAILGISDSSHRQTSPTFFRTGTMTSKDNDLGITIF